MRRYAIALTGSAAFILAGLIAQTAAEASEAGFFTDQHKAYFESGNPLLGGSLPPPPVMEPAPQPAAYQPPAPVQPSYGGAPSSAGDRPGIDTRPLASAIPREVVAYDGTSPAGTIIISTEEKRLYYVLPDHQAVKYGVGVGRPGFEWSGTKTVVMKKEWPDWTPPPEMIKRRPDLPKHMAGGIDNPLGARAMYLGNTMYRIHGSNEPDSIGQAVSSGCIRMTNDDVVDLYERVKIGTRAIVQR